jgi:hypothetical protein
MGLDMYAFTAPKEVVTRNIGFTLSELRDVREIHYWRKHPNLQGWMEELYRAKGGEVMFNCEPMVLTEEDLDKLEDAIRSGQLPRTEGFFFGESDGSEQSDDLAFVKAAREFIADGYAVIYDSWW